MPYARYCSDESLIYAAESPLLQSRFPWKITRPKINCANIRSLRRSRVVSWAARVEEKWVTVLVSTTAVYLKGLPQVELTTLLWLFKSYTSSMVPSTLAVYSAAYWSARWVKPVSPLVWQSSSLRAHSYLLIWRLISSLNSRSTLRTFAFNSLQYLPDDLMDSIMSHRLTALHYRRYTLPGGNGSSVIDGRLLVWYWYRGKPPRTASGDAVSSGSMRTSCPINMGWEH